MNPQMPPVRMCGVYFLKDDSVLFEGIDYEPTGPGGLSSKVLVRLSADATPLLLGIVALRVLEQTSVIDAKVWNFREVLQAKLAMAGVKSNRLLESTAKYLSISWRNDKEIKVIPTESKVSSDGGYSHLTHLAGTCGVQPDDLRDLLLAKVRDCR